MITHKRGSDRYLAFPMIDATQPAKFKSGATVNTIAWGKIGAGDWTPFANNPVTEIAPANGIYETSLTGGLTDYDQILFKFWADGAADQCILLDMRQELAEDLAGAGYDGTQSLQAIHTQDLNGHTATLIAVESVPDNVWAVVPADPTSVPTIGADSILVWQGFFAALSKGEIRVTETATAVFNEADQQLASGANADDGTTFTAGKLG